MANRLRKVLKGTSKEIKEQLKKEGTGDNSASIAINIQLVFEELDIPTKRLTRLRDEMQSFLDEIVRDFARDVELEKYNDVNLLKKGQVEAVGRVGDELFKATLDKGEVKSGQHRV